MTFHLISTTALTLCTLTLIVNAQNYEYEAAPRPAPPRINPSYSGPSSTSGSVRPTPVPILKQINRHNEDGSYTYGYEGADGSFKIETKLPTGEVKGKYGYVDDTGKVRVVEYGATKYGFEPAGEGITVAPPTLVDETTDKNGILKPEFSGAYYDNNNEEPQQVRQYQAPIRPSVPITKAIPRRPAPSIDQSQFEYAGPQQFEPAPPVSHNRNNPVPARAVIPGSVPITSNSNFEFDFPSSAPTRPVQPKSYAPPSRRPTEELYETEPQPRITYAQPAQPRYTQPSAPAPQYRPSPQKAPIRNGGGGILDQLSKDYALPQGGAAPLHDISFGYY